MTKSIEVQIEQFLYFLEPFKGEVRTFRLSVPSTLRVIIYVFYYLLSITIL